MLESENSIIRAKYIEDGLIKLYSHYVFSSYLWSTGDTVRESMLYSDYIMVFLDAETFCGKHLQDSLIVAPSNENVNFIIGKISENIRIVDKEYPIEIKSIYQATNEIPIDLNGDNINDIIFWIQEYHSGQGSIYDLNYKIEELNNTKISGLSNEILQLDSMEILGNQFQWIENGTLMYYSTFVGKRVLFKEEAIKYIGFKLIENNKAFLGWFKLSAH